MEDFFLTEKVIESDIGVLHYLSSPIDPRGSYPVDRALLERGSIMEMSG